MYRCIDAANKHNMPVTNADHRIQYTLTLVMCLLKTIQRHLLIFYLLSFHIQPDIYIHKCAALLPKITFRSIKVLPSI